MDDLKPIQPLKLMKNLLPISPTPEQIKEATTTTKKLPTFFGIPIEKYFLQGVTITLGLILIILGLVFITKAYKFIPGVKNE